MPKFSILVFSRLLSFAFCILQFAFCTGGCAGRESSVDEKFLPKYPLLYLDKNKTSGDTLVAVIMGKDKTEKDTLYLVIPSGSSSGSSGSLEPENEEMSETDTVSITVPEVETILVSTPAESSILADSCQQKDDFNDINEPNKSSLISQNLTPRGELPADILSNFAVQVGAFRDKKYADKLYEVVKDKYGSLAQMEYIDDYWKVRIGGCSSYMQAKHIRDTVRKYMQAWIVKTKY